MENKIEMYKKELEETIKKAEDIKKNMSELNIELQKLGGIANKIVGKIELLEELKKDV